MNKIINKKKCENSNGNWKEGNQSFRCRVDVKNHHETAVHNNYCFNKVLKINPVEVRVWKPPSVSRPVCCRCWQRSSCVAPAPQTPGDWAEPWLSRSGRSARWAPWSGSDGWSRGWRNPRNTQPTPEQEKSTLQQSNITVFFNCLHFQNFASFFKTLHTNPRIAHKMQNASHLLQNEALHSKYHKHISKENICKHLRHNINSC